MKKMLVHIISIAMAVSYALSPLTMVEAAGLAAGEDTGIAGKTTGATESNEIVHSGKSGDLDWSIDSKGCLKLQGRGDYEKVYIDGMEEFGLVPPWWEHGSEIKSAEISVAEATDLSRMFLDCGNLETVNLDGLDTSNVTDMNNMFGSCSSLKNLDLSGLDTSRVTDMGDMFGGCSGLTSLNLSGLDTSSVDSMWYMFSDCSRLTSLNLSGLDTSSVTSMAGTFSGCSSLTNLDLGNFDTSQVWDMMYMFSDCSSLTSLKLSSFDTSNVSDMWEMFSGCSSLESLNLSNFNLEKLSSKEGFFNECGVRTIQTPCNLKEEIELPLRSDGKEQWKDNRGNVYTCLPQNLSSSITISIGKLTEPTEPANPISPANPTMPNQSAQADSPKQTNETSPSPQIKQGDSVTDKASKGSYKVTNTNNKTVAYEKPNDKNMTAVTIPATIQIRGETYKVTAIADNAFNGSKKLKNVKLSANIKTIGKNAFKNCRKLKKLTMGKNVATIGSNAFSGCASLKSITIPSKTTKIGENSFANCKKVKKLVIKSKKLSGKNIGKKAFKGIPGKAVADVPNNKIKAYKKLLRSKGLNAKCRIK